MIRHATAVWSGSGKEGSGKVSTQSAVLDSVNYNYKMRFENEVGTNPEELVAAAHASCFSMKLSFVLGEKGYTPDKIQTRCNVTFEGGAITKSHLVVEATVPGIQDEEFQAAVKNAEVNCPISKSLKAEITSEAKMV